MKRKPKEAKVLKPTTLRLPTDLLISAKIEAAKTGTSLQAIITEALAKRLKEGR
jgi:predicted DNA binding CopG/RHH family protein